MTGLQGAALNVRGRIQWTGDDRLCVEFVPTTLAPAETRDILLAWRETPDRDPKRAHGVIDYEDVALGRWQTRFWVDEEGNFNVTDLQWMMRPDGSVPDADAAYPYRHLV